MSLYNDLQWLVWYQDDLRVVVCFGDFDVCAVIAILLISLSRDLFFVQYGMLLDSLTSVIYQTLPEPHAGLLNGILFGTKTMLSPDLYDALVKTGTLHIVALSGMNISILMTLVNLSFLRLFSRRIASLLTIVVIIGFIWLVGLSPSIIRAAIMSSIGLIAIVFGRQTWAILSLFLAAGFMILLNPLFITDLSFQLSIGATLGIIFFAKKRQKNVALIPRRLLILHKIDRFMNLNRDFTGDKYIGQNLPYKKTINSEKYLRNNNIGFTFPNLWIEAHSWIRLILRSGRQLFSLLFLLIEDDLRVTLSAQVITIPIILFAFDRISLVSPLTNVLIGWLMAPIMVMGLAVVALGVLWMPLAQVAAWIVWVPLEIVLWAITLTSTIPFASIGW